MELPRGNCSPPLEVVTNTVSTDLVDMDFLKAYTWLVLTLAAVKAQSAPSNNGDRSTVLPQAQLDTNSNLEFTTQIPDDSPIETYPIPIIPDEFNEYVNHERPFAFNETEIVLAKEQAIILTRRDGVMCANVTAEESDNPLEMDHCPDEESTRRSL